VLYAADQLKRLTRKALRERLGASPESPWRAPKATVSGGVFVIESWVDARAVSALSARLRASSAEPGPIAWRSRVTIGAGYARRESADEEARDAAIGIEHPEFGALCLEPAKRSYWHLGLSQIPVANLPRKAGLFWEVAPRDGGIDVRLLGPVSLVLEVELLEGSIPRDLHAPLWCACLPQLDQLGACGLPLDDLVKHGAPGSITIRMASSRERRGAPLATHRVGVERIGQIAPACFSIPEGYTDSRARREGPGEPFPLGAGRPLRPAPRKSAQAMTASRTMIIGAPGTPTSGVLLTPELPACLPSTFQATSALHLRQQALDTIQQLGNLAGKRLQRIAASRTGASTRLRLEIDWLAQLKQAHDALPGGDALFCLLRDVPDPAIAGSGGLGLLDRLAAQIAAALLDRDEPLPFGGEGTEVPLPASDVQAVEEEITSVTANGAIVPAQRFDALSAPTREILREAVLEARLASFETRIAGNFGKHKLPSPEFNLVEVSLQLESFAITLGEDEHITDLSISVDNDGTPRIGVRLILPSLVGEVSMVREPGDEFWITTGGVLVAGGIIATAAIGAVLVTLIGLGPLGFVLLAGLVSQAPALVLLGIAGGVFLAGAIAYLVWEESILRLEMTDADVSFDLVPGIVGELRGVSLHSRNVRLRGTIAASVASQTPAGMDAMLDAVVNAAIPAFEGAIRDLIEDKLPDSLDKRIAAVPPLHIPLPFSREFNVPATLPALPGPLAPEAETRLAPRHLLVGGASDGVAERFLSMAAATAVDFPFPQLRPFTTQVQADLRETLTRLMEAEFTTGRDVVMGYALSENVLNAIVHTHWIRGRFAREYNTRELTRAFARLIAACPACAAIDENQTAHAWAAAAPIVTVIRRAHDEAPQAPYLQVRLPDLRLCLGGTAGKPSSLELRFSATAIAHVVFGQDNGTTGRTLFVPEGDFVDVAFSEVVDACSLDVGTQGLVASGPGFDTIAAFDAAQRVQFLEAEAMRAELVDALNRVLRRQGVAGLDFSEGAAFDQQTYDGLIQARIVPEGASVFALFRLTGPILNTLKHRRQDDTLAPPLFDLDTRNCAGGVEMRSLLGP
jgi:hypothetical protein